MSDVKQVKVDNWGIYFLQRLKHFFNRTDYCDLTLQFQDNAQLKVHRLVLSACTEYFELLERTCEMYEDCLVMPDDLQADVVVPIVNFMYTGHLEFKMDILERLYQTSQILNMPVLSKLLESHRNLAPKAPAHSYSGIKKFTRQNEPKPAKITTPTAGSSNKRSYSKAFDNNIVYRDKKTYQPVARTENVNNSAYRPSSPISKDSFTSQKLVISDPRPTRYEVPEELDNDNIFDNSFCSISYTSQPLMVHPDTVKRYKAKRNNVFNEASGSKKMSGLSTIDIVECKRIRSRDDNLFDDRTTEHNFNDETELFNTSYMNNEKDPNQLFDQILDPNDGPGGPKVTIETKDSKAASNLDHARIISEVLKKYPHLVKSNKNIKLKILDPVPSKGRKQQKQSTAPAYVEDKPLKLKTEEDDFTYETDVIDSKQAAKLIAMGADNTKGPWICLICGTPGKALHFNSYFKFRRHLVEVHNEKPVANICEYCGLRSLKRNYLLHHLYAQHGVQPPPQYHFPKCNSCTYIALTDALLTKHKLSHKDIKNFRCNVCSAAFASSNQLLQHIQNTGHKYSAEKKSNLQCIYCMKVFLREINLYSHIKTHHKQEAKTDCIIEDSDEEKHTVIERPRAKGAVKFEPSTSYDNEYEEVDLQYPIQRRPSTDKQVPVRRQINVNSNAKQKILNPGFGTPKPALKAKPSKTINHTQSVQNDFFQDIKLPVESLSNSQDEEIVLIDNNEYILRDHQLIPKKRKPDKRDYIISDMIEPDSLETIQQPTTSMEYTVQNTSIEENVQQQSSMVIKKSANLNQPIQIVVSNEEEYKALMASNHPIIFDDGGTNKTLTVLTAPHHNQAIEATAIDLDNTPGSEMMILPHEYPLNVSEAVATENSNIVVVYSHPVDDQNKQFQILTTGGIGAQFVQSSAIITQNYETVTTTTPAMNTHCIETQVEQTWQNNMQNLEGQQIQLPPHTVMLNSNQIVTGPIHSATGNHLDDLPEVHFVPEPQKGISPGETDVDLNQSDVTIEHINQQDEQETIEENVACMSLIQNETTTVSVNETVETLPQAKTMPDIQTNHENIEEPIEMENILEQPPASEHVMEQPMETEIVQEQPIQTENVLEQPTTETEIVLDQPMEIDNVIDQPVETEYVIEQPLVTENVMVMEQPLENEIDQTTVNVMEQPLETRNMMEQQVETRNMMNQPVETRNMMEAVQTEIMIEQHVDTGNVLEQPIETDTPMEHPAELENVIEQPVERVNVIEQPIETECLIKPSPTPQNPQEHTVDSVTINKYSEVGKPQNDTSQGQQPELMESQAYDDIVEINRANDEEIVYAKESEKKIKNLTLDWSEDEYDVAEDGNRIAKSVSNKVSQNQPIVEEIPEVEESIENIQQEMQKQMAAHLEAGPAADLEEGAAADLEEGPATDLEEGAAADLDEGPAADLDEGAAADLEEGLAADLEEGPAADLEEGPAADLEEGPAADLEEEAAATTYLPNVADVETEESAISSQEEDSSSQEMQLAPFNDLPVLTAVPNPLVQQKLSSLLNDWEDNDSQEEMITVNENVVEPTTEQSPKDTSACSPEIPEGVPKTIKSLVSDWDDDEEETKE